MATTAAQPPRTFQRIYPGRADQVRLVRRDMARDLAGCPAADDAVLIASEIATNAIRHSRSFGSFLVMRAELHPGHALISCENAGVTWQPGRPDGRPHGLDVVQALTGPGGWGTRTTGDGDRIVWARLSWQASRPGPRRRRETIPAEQAAIVGANIRALRQRRGWTQPQLGALMGWLHPSTVCAAEGHRTSWQRSFTTAEINKLAAIFGIPPEQLTTRCATCAGRPPNGLACLACGAGTPPRSPAPARPAPARPVPEGHAAARG